MMAAGGGTTAGAGKGTGFRLWAEMLAPSTIISNSRTPATLRIFFVCSKPVILKLLPSSSFNFVTVLCLADWGKASCSCRTVLCRKLIAAIGHPQQVFQERRQRFTAILSSRWNFHELRRGLPRMFRVHDHRIAIRALRMTVRCNQLWVIKWRCLAYGARIGQCIAQEINQVCLVLKRQSQVVDVGIHVLMFFTKGVEVAASVVELNYLFQRQLAAIVEVRSGQRHVAQLRRFKEAASRRFVAAIQRSHGNAVSRTSRDHDCLRGIVANALSQ